MFLLGLSLVWLRRGLMALMAQPAVALLQWARDQGKGQSQDVQVHVMEITFNLCGYFVSYISKLANCEK